MANMATSSPNPPTENVTIDLTNIGPPPVGAGYETQNPPSPDAFQFVPQNVEGRPMPFFYQLFIFSSIIDVVCLQTCVLF